ncbi:hypothetical protein L2E82_32735 [Cichorium intybus]|uniref:Uncharacterized protein n=1 Tax=Cichorium intybus TaxID=13427 RepID=A0ACB9BGT2_CICIN|nr:hypothetical protein L2E82_32735 [Cichorium intybus]
MGTKYKILPYLCLRSDKNPNFPLFLSPPLNFLSLYAIPLSTARASPMATAGDGATPYQSGGAGGKFRKRPIRRSALATPYDRPSTALRNKSPSLFSKLVDPASRLIYAGADRLFGVFRKRLPSIAAPRPPEINEKPEPSTDEGGNLASISATTEISELENMLKQKTFTRSEIEHLTALLHSKTTKSDDEEDRPKLPSPSSHLLRLKASTSSPLNKHVEEKENFHAVISTPAVTSTAFEEDVASPAELARAYMGTRTPKVSPPTLRFGSQAPRQDSVLLNTTTILPKTPITSLVPRTAGTFKALENGLTTPRSRGRSAIYSMARTPYYRPPSAFSQKGMNSPSLPLSQPAWEQEGSIESSKMASKRRSSVLDDIGSGGPVRRIRQKANLLSQGSPLSKNRNEFGHKLLLRNEPDPKFSKAIEENGETSRSNLGYASVPTKSTQMATKILEQLERLSPKEKSPGSRLARISDQSPSKLTSNMVNVQEKVDSPKLLLSSQDIKKPESSWLTESTSQSKGKEKVEENGPRKFAVPRNVLSTMNGNASLPVKDKGPIVTNTDSSFKLPVEPPQKKRFQMSALEDVDDESRSNGHVSILLGENKKVETSVFASDEVIQTSALPEVNKASQPQAEKIPEMPEFKKVDGAIPLPKTDFKSFGGSSVNEKKVSFNLPPSTTNNNNNGESDVVSQSTLVTDTVASQKKAPVFPTFGIKNAENKPLFSFSTNESSGFNPDAKAIGSTSLFNSVKENNQVQLSAPKKDDNGNSPKSVNIFGKSESLTSASPIPTPTPASASASGIFSFGAKTSSITNGTPASSPTTFTSMSSFPASGTSTNNLFSSSPLSGSTITSAASSALPTSVSPPIFSFGSSITPSNKAAEPPEITVSKDEEAKPDSTTSTSFTAATTGSSMFGFSSPAANDQQSFGTPAFGVSPSTNASGSAFSSTPSFGLSSAVATSETKSSSSSMFSSTWQPPKSSTPTAFSFGASSTSTSPSVFGASTGSSMFSFTSGGPTNPTFPAPSHSPSIFGNSTPVFGNNNDQMSMEDSMAEDSTPSPSLPAFGQASSTPGFMFGSTTLPPSTPPFQFGGQTNQPPAPNPFQASGSGDFTAGGSFSLGSGGDKSGRRILKVKRSNRRK